MKKTLAIYFPLLVASPVIAQTSPAVNIERNVEQNLHQNTLPLQVVKPQSAPPPTSLKITKLINVVVVGEITKRTEIEAYLQDYIGQAVPENVLDDFEYYTWRLIQREGYLGYVTLSTTDSKNGQTLVVTIKKPLVNQVTINTQTSKLPEQYQKKITNRLNSIITPKAPLDLKYLENKLEGANFDLPVYLSASIQRSGKDAIDVNIYTQETTEKFGKVKNALIQINDYGLRTYGRPQILGNLALVGFTPNSEIDLTGLQSEGVSYIRGNYMFPTMLLAGQVNLWSSYSHGRGIRNTITDTKEHTLAAGGTLVNVLATTRSMIIKSSIGFETRKTSSRLKTFGISIQSLRDNKVKLSLISEMNDRPYQQINSEVTLVRGHYVGFESYLKVEARLSFLQTLTEDGRYFTTLQVRGQTTNKNLDGYDKISLGGVTGVRGFNSGDGVGDIGAVASFDLYRRFGGQYFAGIFYNIGIIKPHHTAMRGLSNTHYTLQSAGLSIGGYIRSNLSFNASLAKGIGSYKGYIKGNPDSKPRNLRLLISVTASY